eukprot:gb/GECG01012267.1/.p1 GENE.gb/GECG01012267.1/~~gb/GECG01012267.1/.p1  ORF type:complete len:392 (+),score=47.17 gb/GECG01012267.1/:1-1176(+)
MNLRRIVKYYLLVFGVPFSMCLALRFVLLSVAIAQLCGTVGVISSYPEESEIDYSGPSFTSSSSTKRMKAIVAEEGKCKLVERETPRPQDGEVLVRVHYTGINRLDTIQRKGVMPPPAGVTDVLGLEMSGEVVDQGSGCKKQWNAGQRVMGLLSGGGYAEFVAVPEGLLIPLPDQLSFEHSAAIPENWLTAYQLLHFIAGVKSSDRVLVHAAGSGVGTAAIQLINHVGAEAYAVASTTEKLDRAKRLGAKAGFNYKMENWSEELLKVVPQGVTVVLDCIGASFWQNNSDVIAQDGRWVLYGLLGGPNIDGPLFGKLLRKRVQLTATTMRTRPLEYKSRLVAAFVDNALPGFVDNQLVPVIDKQFALDQAQDAHDYMESNQNIGKILLKVLN